ncbi:hypothetical protein G6F23_013438 [Rhizopus arrhizus]|nr:hypothetical protein G6F23_013438 [Rhizopus arrhizus]
MMAQNNNFWPALKRPTGGSFSSSLRSTSRMPRSHARSSAVGRLSRHMRKASKAKPITMARPMNGCRMRVHGPPPNSWVNGNRAGWNSASPDSAVSTKQIATTQWLMRVGAR